MKRWREIKDASGSQKSKIKENHYQRIVSAEKMNEIDRKMKIIYDPWKQREEAVPWQGDYKVIAHKKCFLQTTDPQYFKVIKRNRDKLYYELKQ